MSVLKGALLGFGQVAEAAHAPAWRAAEGLRVCAVSDPDPARRAAAEKALPGARTYASASELFKREKGLSFVDIAAPPFLHAELASAALAGGLHVLCEKPLVLSRAEFSALSAEASRRRLALFTVHNWKEAPILRRLKDLLRSGAIGRLRHIELHTLRSRPAATASAAGNWRTDRKLSGGGILVDHGWHQVYLLHWLVGEPPIRASGVLRRPKAGAAEDEAFCLIEFPGVSAALHLTWRAARRSHWGAAYGELGSIELKDDHLLVFRGEEPPQKFAFPEALSAGSAHPEWFADALTGFKAAVETPAARAENLAEADSCLRVIESVYAAESRLQQAAA